jgi:hypothetical protein
MQNKTISAGVKLSRFEYCCNAQVQLPAAFVVVPSSYPLPNELAVL